MFQRLLNGLEHELDDDQNKAPGLITATEALLLKQSPELSGNRISSESDRRHYCGLHQNRLDRHRALREPWLRSRLGCVPRRHGR